MKHKIENIRSVGNQLGFVLFVLYTAAYVGYVVFTSLI